MLLPLLAWLIALATLAGAAHELRRQREITESSAVLAAVPRFTLKSSALGLADYQAIQKKTAVFGTVEIVPGPSSLFIRATALSDYAAWRLTIDQVLLDNPGVSWRIDARAQVNAPWVKRTKQCYWAAAYRLMLRPKPKPTPRWVQLFTANLKVQGKAVVRGNCEAGIPKNKGRVGAVCKRRPVCRFSPAGRPKILFITSTSGEGKIMRTRIQLPSRQKGFSLLTGFILVIIMLGSLAFFLAGQGINSSFGAIYSNTSKASSLLTSAGYLKAGFDSVLLNGTVANEVRFNDAVNVGMFNSDTGGAAPQPLDPLIFDTAVTSKYWIYRSNLILLENVGGSGNLIGDYTVIAVGLREAICQQINNILYGSTTIPLLAAAPLLDFLGTPGGTAQGFRTRLS